MAYKDFNQLGIIGRLTDNPKLQYSASGTAFVSFSIASNYYKGNNETDVSFFNCVVWGKRAEALSEYASKGGQICINGEIRQDRYETKKGEKRSQIKIHVDDFFLLGGKHNGKNNSSEDENENENENDGESSSPKKEVEEERDEYVDGDEEEEVPF